MTSMPGEPAARTDDERWADWRAGYAASDQRASIQMRWIAVVAFAGAAGWLLLAVLNGAP